MHLQNLSFFEPFSPHFPTHLVYLMKEDYFKYMVFFGHRHILFVCLRSNLNESSINASALMLTLFRLILRNESINFAHYVIAESILIPCINNLLLSDVLCFGLCSASHKLCVVCC